MITMTRTAHRRLFYRPRRRANVAIVNTEPVGSASLGSGYARVSTVAPLSQPEGARLDRAEMRIGRHDRVLLGKCLDITLGENRRLTDAEWRRAVDLRAKLSIIKPA